MNTIDDVRDRQSRDEVPKPKPARHRDLHPQNYGRGFDPEHDEWGDQLEED